MPGQAFYESDAQYSRLVGYFAGTSYGFICLFQDAARVFEERFSRCTYFHSSGKTIEQFKTNLIFQILNLPGERRLSDAQTLGSPAKVLLLGGCHKISQMSQFHWLILCQSHEVQVEVLLGFTSLRCHDNKVSGVTMVAVCIRALRLRSLVRT